MGSLEAKLDMLIKGEIKLPEMPMTVNEPEMSDTVCIGISGEIVKRLGLPREILEFVGIQDLDFLDDDLNEVLENDSIKNVMLDFSSGGGSVIGLPETGELIEELDKRKNVIAYTDTYMCSAAYELAAHCSKIYASPSSIVGMVGTYCQRLDISEALAKQGVKVETFAGGIYKTMYVPEIPLTDVQRAAFIEDIAESVSEFKAVVKSKHDVADEDMQGRIYTGKVALTKGLIDGLANNRYEAMQMFA